MRAVVEKKMTSWDGAELAYRVWLPQGKIKKSVMLFHRGHEHSARWQETVDAFGMDDVAFFAWDQRGHGKSPGERGSAKNIGVFIRDAEAFSRHLMSEYGILMEDTVVVAHSVGAVVATAWVHDYAPSIRGLVLGAPAFRVKLYVPFAIPFLRLRQKLLGHGYVRSYVKSKVLTHDAEQARLYDADQSIFKQIAVNILLDLFDTSSRLIRDAGAITAPLMILAAGNDWIVRIAPQKEFLDRASSRVKQFEVLHDFYHAIFHEKNRHVVVSKIGAFIKERFEQPYASANLLSADKEGFVYEEYKRLLEPGGVKWGIARLLLRTVGRLSKGIDVGLRYGFDSGIMLDYVYRNKAEGITPVGRLIDRQYLDSVGWRGIRLRRENLQRLLEKVIRDVRASGREARILDVAAGGGRYVLETIYRMKDVAVRCVLRDYKPENIEAIQKLAKELHLEEVITAKQGDAFDRASLAATTPRPTIGIVSGLYELFPGNDEVQRSLQGIADAVEPGGYLIYTGQPWHPQVESIAKVLTNREGQFWVMRRRTQAEMDQLVEGAGFEKIAQEMDPWGIFSVSVARRKFG